MILESLINHYIALDPDLMPTLNPWRGKSIKIILTDLDYTVYLTIEDNKVAIQAKIDADPTTTLRGSSMSFLHLAVAGPVSARTLFQNEISLEGDTEFAHSLQQTLDAMHIDWEEHLSQFTGDVVAHHAFQKMRATQSWLQSLKQSATADTGEFLKEESKLLPTQTQFQTFSRSVDALSLNCDRLMARIHRLMAPR